jgi:uncharacterized glyoxalase superfamily protein PhnB
MPAAIIPSLRYRNAPAAIEWLCRVFGLQRHLVVPDESGGIAHAQLSFGDGMMMLGSVRDNEWETLLNSRTKSAARLRNPFTSSYRMLMSLTNERKTPVPKS